MVKVDVQISDRHVNVIRLHATGLYTSEQIAKASGIAASTVRRIYNERVNVPDGLMAPNAPDPLLSFEEAARVANVNVTVIRGLVLGGHLRSRNLTPYSDPRLGSVHDINGNQITEAVIMSSVVGINLQWVSIEDAYKIAGMMRPRGMYNRVTKGQVVSIKAPDGEAFHIHGKTGLKILIGKGSIKPAQQKAPRTPKDPRQQELPLEAKQPEFTMVIVSDAADKPIIVPGKGISITVSLDNMSERSVKQVLKVDVDLMPDDRPRVRTETYA